MITSMAAFGPGWPQRPGRRTATPAAFRYRLAVSRAYPGRVLDLAEAPAEASQGEDLVLFLSVQDVSHGERGYPPRPRQRPGRLLGLWPLFR